MTSRFGLGALAACVGLAFASSALPGCSSGGTQPVSPALNGLSQYNVDPTDTGYTAKATDDAAKAAGVAYWEAHVRADAGDVGGAPDIHVTFFGHDANNVGLVAGKFSLRSAVLAGVDTTNDLLGGAFAALSDAQGNPTALLADADRDALLASVASSFAATNEAPGASTQTADNGAPTCNDGSAFTSVSGLLAAALKSSASTCGATCGAGMTPRPMLSGMNINPHFGHDAQGAATTADAAAYGINTVRFTFVGTTTPNDVADPTASINADVSSNLTFNGTAIQAMHDAKVKVILTISSEALAAGYNCMPASIDPSCTQHWASWDDYVKTYTAVVLAAATKYKGLVDAYELWNEPDDSGSAPLAATQLIPLLNAGIAAIRSVDSAVPIICGIATVSYYNQLLGTAGGVATVKKLSAYNLHPYNNWPDLAQPPSTATAGLKKYFPTKGQSLSAVLHTLATDVMSRAGEKPIWFSEWGADLPTASDETAYITAFYKYLSAPPPADLPLVAGIEKTWFFAWSDAMPSAGHYFGLRSSAGTDKDSGNVRKAFTNGSGAKVLSTACRACEDSFVGSVIASIDKQPTISGWLCCKGLVGCTTANAPILDSCDQKQDGTYCSAYNDYSAYRCIGGSQGSAPSPCGTGQHCVQTTATQSTCK